MKRHIKICELFITFIQYLEIKKEPGFDYFRLFKNLSELETEFCIKTDAT